MVKKQTKFIKDRINALYQQVTESGLEGVAKFTKRNVAYLMSPTGEPVFQKDWDILVVLDGCRLDLMKEVEQDYEFISDVGSINSVGTTSCEWMKKSFNQDHVRNINDTIYVSGNAWSESCLPQNQFKELDEVWRYAWDDELGTIPPRPITDRAIALSRQHQYDRMVIHYMQPHVPFVASGEKSGFSLDDWGNEKMSNVWADLKAGNISEREFWKRYKQNLKYVLDDVQLLLNNIDAESIIITSDHGNALGEYNIYEHPSNMRIPALYKVPWITTTGEDTGSHEPEDYPVTQTSSTAEERLRKLGYL